MYNPSFFLLRALGFAVHIICVNRAVLFPCYLERVHFILLFHSFRRAPPTQLFFVNFASAFSNQPALNLIWFLTLVCIRWPCSGLLLSRAMKRSNNTTRLFLGGNTKTVESFCAFARTNKTKQLFRALVLFPGIRAFKCQGVTLLKADLPFV